jgi:hypothetical protein
MQSLASGVIVVGMIGITGNLVASHLSIALLAT